jgi:hypothetical protein
VLLVLELEIELLLGDAKVAVAVDLYVVGGPPPTLFSYIGALLEFRYLALCTLEELNAGTISASNGSSTWPQLTGGVLISL